MTKKTKLTAKVVVDEDGQMYLILPDELTETVTAWKYGCKWVNMADGDWALVPAKGEVWESEDDLE